MHFFPKALASSLLVLVGAAISAQEPAPRLVAPFAAPAVGSQGTALLAAERAARGVVFFVWRVDTGHELWRAPEDGGAGATRLLDLCPLIEQPGRRAVVAPRLLVREGQVLFRSECGNASTLWVTDGSVAGTRLVAPGFDLVDDRAGVGVVPGSGEALIFGSYQGVPGLWAFGDLAAPPRRLAALSQLPIDYLPRATALSAATAHGLVFSAFDSEGRADAWVSDGTALGTRKLARLGEEIFRQYGFGFVALGSRVLFFAGTPGAQLWSTDGTPEGTSAHSGVSFLSRADARIFVGDRRAWIGLPSSVPGTACWVSDGTRGGTRPADSCTTVVWKDRGVFSREQQLWTSDGASSVPLAGLPPGRWEPWFVSDVHGLVAERQSSGGPAELWLIGSAGATPRRFFTGASDFLGVFGESEGRLFFADFVPAFPDDEARLWSSDGTSVGTLELAREPALETERFQLFDSGVWWTAALREDRLQLLRFETERRVVLDFPRYDAAGVPGELQATGDFLWFSTRDRSSGSPKLYRAASSGVEERFRSSLAAGLAYRAMGESAAYWTEQGPYDLWWLDEEGSHSRYRTRALSYEFAFRRPPVADAPGGALFLDADGLYRISAADGQVETVKALPLGSLDQSPYFARSGDDLYFFQRSGERLNQGQLWRTDGTGEGTVLRAEVAGRLLAASPERLYWFGDDGRLWSQAAAGGAAVQLESGPSPRRLASLVALANHACLPYARELWRTDGSEAGTFRLKARTPPWRPESRTTSFPGVGFAGRCFFVSDDADTGHELWSTDGTVAGTRIVVDLWPGPAGSFPDGLTVVGDRLVFRASDGAFGAELWSTDGTAAGTRRHTDLVPGPAAAEPADFAVWGSELAFTAADGGTLGRQVWALPLSALGEGEGVQPPAPDGDWLTSSQVPGFRLKVLVAGSPGRLEPLCLAETACVSGALAGRPEVFLRVVGPKPNGFLWPTLVKFSTSEVEVWIEQIGLGTLRYYRLAGARPGLDELPALFDREGFWPPPGAALVASVEAGGAEPPPPDQWVTAPAIPGFRFAVTIAGNPTRREPSCLAETLCVSGAIPGRSEVFVRVVGPKPNGFLWPTLARFSTAEVEVWIEQVSTGARQHYRLEAAGPGRDDLTGLFDREGFLP